MNAERWLPVVGWEGYYEVSDHGRVRSIDRVVMYSNGRRSRLRGKVLSAATTPHGHLFVNLNASGKRRTIFVHRLMLEAFVGPAPEGKPFGLHWNDIGDDNRLENLRWGSQEENIQDCIRNGNHPSANKTHCKREHLLVAPNLLENKVPRRVCKACDRARHTITTHGGNFQALADEIYEHIVTGIEWPSKCDRGHPYSGANLRKRTEGGSGCVACMRANISVRVNGGDVQELSDRIFADIAAGTAWFRKAGLCKRDHKLIDPNLVVAELKRGNLKCKACDRARSWVRNHPGTDMQTVSDSYYAEIMGSEAVAA